MICTTDEKGSPALPPEFREKLRKRYLDEYREDVWRNEEEEAMRSSEAIMVRLAGRYSRPDPLGVGGTAIVLRVLDCNLARVAINCRRIRWTVLRYMDGKPVFRILCGSI